MTIPIFVITKDRLTCLKQCIKTYEKLGDVQIVLLDNGSTYPPMVEFLAEFGKTHTIMINGSVTGGFSDISEFVGAAIKKWYTMYDAPYYVVTDPDIELENPSPDFLTYYERVLDCHPDVPVVGPMLRINDIPDSFRLKEPMVKSHIIQFWQFTPHDFNGVKIQRAAIDTTFGMYRKGFEFRRLNYGIRVHEPYMARHLDWYIDLDNPSEEQVYYWSHASNVSTLKRHVIDKVLIGW